MKYTNDGDHLFILGSARSGTSLMSSIIEASDEFTTYRAETKLLHSSHAVYGDLNNASSREKFWQDWYRSRQFFRTGLSRDEIEKATGSLRSYIAILGTYMDLIANKQNKKRWVDSTPSNVNCIKDIATTFPNAKILHMARDGRAVSLSLAKLGWTGARTNDFDTSLLFSALKWQQSVEKFYETKHHVTGRYMKVHYESFIKNPVDTLKQISEFLELKHLDPNIANSKQADEKHDVNSSLKTPNSPFGDMSAGISTNAMYRWKSMLDESQIEKIESYIGDTLKKLDYPCINQAHLPLSEKTLLQWRKSSSQFKRALKHHTPLGRFSVSSLEFNKD